MVFVCIDRYLDGEDFVEVSGTLTFTAGMTQSTFSVTIVNDNVAEGDEQFTVSLSNPSTGLAVGTDDTATVNILDDEGLYACLGRGEEEEGGGGLEHRRNRRV
jgi:hypothetical protein